jgi:hypothetical protein
MQTSSDGYLFWQKKPALQKTPGEEKISHWSSNLAHMEQYHSEAA